MTLGFSLDYSELETLRDEVLDPFRDDLGIYEVNVMAACAVLDEAGARFHFSGFGREDWRMDVGYDMSMLVEDLPYILHSLGVGEEYEFFWGSQGVELELKFTPLGEFVRVHCTSRVDRVVDPDEELVEKASLMAMLERLAIDISSALASVSSPLIQEEPFRTWSGGCVPSMS